MPPLDDAKTLFPETATNKPPKTINRLLKSILRCQENAYENEKASLWFWAVCCFHKRLKRKLHKSGSGKST